MNRSVVACSTRDPAFARGNASPLSPVHFGVVSHQDWTDPPTKEIERLKVVVKIGYLNKWMMIIRNRLDLIEDLNTESAKKIDM